MPDPMWSRWSLTLIGCFMIFHGCDPKGPITCKLAGTRQELQKLREKLPVKKRKAPEAEEWGAAAPVFWMLNGWENTIWFIWGVRKFCFFHSWMFMLSIGFDSNLLSSQYMIVHDALGSSDDLGSYLMDWPWSNPGLWSGSQCQEGAESCCQFLPTFSISHFTLGHVVVPMMSFHSIWH